MAFFAARRGVASPVPQVRSCRRQSRAGRPLRCVRPWRRSSTRSKELTGMSGSWIPGKVFGRSPQAHDAAEEGLLRITESVSRDLPAVGVASPRRYISSASSMRHTPGVVELEGFPHVGSRSGSVYLRLALSGSR